MSAEPGMVTLRSRVSRALDAARVSGYFRPGAPCTAEEAALDMVSFSSDLAHEDPGRVAQILVEFGLPAGSAGGGTCQT